jgi:hypothetical protein
MIFTTSPSQIPFSKVAQETVVIYVPAEDGTNFTVREIIPRHYEPCIRGYDTPHRQGAIGCEMTSIRCDPLLGIRSSCLMHVGCLFRWLRTHTEAAGLPGRMSLNTRDVRPDEAAVSGAGFHGISPSRRATTLSAASRFLLLPSMFSRRSSCRSLIGQKYRTRMYSRSTLTTATESRPISMP